MNGRIGQRGTALAVLAAVIGAAGLAWLFLGESDSTPVSETTGMTEAAVAGKILFDANCALCHGEQAKGTDQGPPLVHPIYEPSHHGDAAFHRAVQQGSPAHHWQFGDMPPVAGLSEADVERITAYVRSLQRAAGIE